jgi:hypothetical protein
MRWASGTDAHAFSGTFELMRLLEDLVPGDTVAKPGPRAAPTAAPAARPSGPCAS